MPAFVADLAGRLADDVLVQVAVREHDLAELLHLVLVGREPDLSGREELLDRLLVALFRGQHELLVRADDAVVERSAGDDLLGGVLKVDVAIDDDRHVAGADAVGRLARGVGGLHHGAAAGRDDDVRGLHQRLRGLDGAVGDHLDEVLGGAVLLQDLPVGARQVARGRLRLGMRREDDRVAGLEREHGVAHRRHDRIRDRAHGGNHAHRLSDQDQVRHPRPRR